MLRSQQAVRFDLPRVDVVTRSSKTRGTKNPTLGMREESYFVVGETPVGGEEIVG